MGIRGSRFRGKAISKGRPREFAKAEIGIMRERQRIEDRKRRRNFFTLLDIILVVSLLASIYLFYRGNTLNGVLALVVGVAILVYFLIRNRIRK
jgi:hypothetical protein